MYFVRNGYRLYRLSVLKTNAIRKNLTHRNVKNVFFNIVVLF